MELTNRITLSVEVAGNIDTRTNLFQTVIQRLSDAPEWGPEIAKTWQNLATIVEIYLNCIIDPRDGELVTYDQKVFLANIINACAVYDLILLHGGKESDYRKFRHVTSFLERLSKNKRLASHESVFVIAYIFKINILVIDADNGFLLAQPWISQKTTITICLLHQPQKVNGRVDHFYRLVKGIN